MEMKVRESSLVNKSSVEDVTRAYAEYSQVDGFVSEQTKDLKPVVIDLVNKEGKQKTLTTKVYDGGDYSVEVATKTLSSIDPEELAKICKRKNIEIGKSSMQIIPKNSGAIPEDVLETLDKYFVLNKSLEATVVDVDNALDVGLITKADRAKIVNEKPSFAVKVKVTDQFSGAIGTP